ncbi:MAG: hypothetical protein ACRC2T_13570, partial [Thermoguttaceae bacterium]
YMDFGEKIMVDGFVCGNYEQIDPAMLPPLYIAFSEDNSEPTEVFHNNLRFRFDQGELKVVEAMKTFAELTEKAKSAISAGDAKELSRLMDSNFDLRRSICQLPKEQVAMIETARSVGVSAKFAGSGGAIIGVCESDEKFAELQKTMKSIGCICVKPILW